MYKLLLVAKSSYRRVYIILLLTACLMMTSVISAQEPTIERLATGLQNPRGIAVMPDGRLLVAQSGTGFYSRNESRRTGSLSVFDDVNGDGDYDDEGEIIPIVSNIATYNSLTLFETGLDEVNGINDIVLLDDGRLFFSKDEPAPGISPEDLAFADTGIFWVDSSGGDVTRIINRPATINAIDYDAENDIFYLAESGLDRLLAMTPDGEILQEVQLNLLAHDQHPVPAGLTFDPNTGEVLVALFSGLIPDYYGIVLTFMPGDAKIIRFNPETGDISDEITGLTTAVDVAIDEHGNIFVVELTKLWASEVMPPDFPLLDPDTPPDSGGYVRFSGRVSMYPADGGDPVILADGLDEPTNVTYHEGALYISVGQGTPGRSIVTRDGLTQITGEIYRITNFLP